jgi:hypothetical protein
VAQGPKISSVWLTSTKPLSEAVVAAQRSNMTGLTSTAAAQERQMTPRVRSSR